MSLEISKIMQTVKNTVSIDESYKNITAGLENKDAVKKGEAIAKKENIIAAVESVFKMLEHGEEGSVEAGTVKFSPAQIEAAKAAAVYATDPIAALESFAKGRKAPETIDNAVTVDGRNLVDDFIPDNEITAGIESFDGQNVSASIFTTVVYNALVVVQDAVSELFYPIYVIDPNVTGYTVTGKITNITKTIKRDISGKPVDWVEESIIKHLDDTEMFTLDANKLLPVYRDESKEYLYDKDEVKRSAKVFEDETITTAPILVNKEVDILAISQSDELIARGLMDQTDALNAHLNLTKLYFEVSGKDADDNDVTEIHVKDIDGLPATFTYTPTGDNKDLQLDYKTKSLAWIGGKIKTVAGDTTAIKKLKDVPDNYTIKIGLVLKGDANARKGTCIIYSLKVELVEVLDGAGNAISKDSDIYKNIEDVMSTLTLKAYDLDAYANNSNARFRGKLLNTTVFQYVYTVPVRNKFREITPVFKNGPDADTAGLLAQIDFTRKAISKFGLLELNKTANVLENVSVDTKQYGLSTELINKYYLRDVLEINKLVDSLRSADREEDIKAALKLKIRNYAEQMYAESGYTFAFEAIYPNQKPTVIIGTDVATARFLGDWSDEMFNYVVKHTNDSLMKGKLFMSFRASNNTKETNPLNFGICGYSPETVIALQRQEKGILYNETVTMPRFKHQTFLPILTMLEIKGVHEVTGKQPITFQEV